MLLAALVLWIGLPVLAVATLFTVIGIPTGLAVLLFLLPAVGFLGYLVSGVRLGDLLLRRICGATAPDSPVAAAIVGLASLVLLEWIPGLGAVITPVAALFGSGALALTVWQTNRPTKPERLAIPGCLREVVPPPGDSPDPIPRSSATSML